jgi:hypothetical protein
MTLKSLGGLIKRIIVLVLIVVVVATGIVACGKSSPEKTTDTTYKLTHTAADVEYILSWDLIVSRCPEIGDFDKQESFIRRGENKQLGTGGTSSMEMDSPAAWGSMRTVMTEVKEESFRGFGVYIMYCDLDEYLDEYMSSGQMSGLPFQEEGDFRIAVLESGPPTRSVQIHLVGKQFYTLLLATASSDESLFFSKEQLMELLPGVKSNISSLEITPLPSDIPERQWVEATPYEWHEFMTFRSDELPPPVRVPEEDFFNDLIFSERPLMQVFNFTIDKGWRFVMTATGEIDTRFEVYVTITSSGEEGFSYSTDQVFSLYSETVTLTREQPLEEGYEPPVNIKIKVYYDQPIAWIIKIEK